MQTGKQIRLGRLFNADTGSTVIVAIDHGLGGQPTGLADIRGRLGAIIDGEPDGLILSAGVMRHMSDMLLGRGRPGLVVTVDRRTGSTLPGTPSRGDEYMLTVPVEDAARLGADGVKMVMIYGRDSAGVHADNVKAVAHVASECERHGLPLILEPVLWGEHATDEQRADPDILAHICRMGVEAGADLLKTHYVPDGYAEVVAETPVPMVILGGDMTDSDDEMLGMVSGAMDGGARGVAFGRNVFGRQDPAAAIRDIRKVVHG